MRKLSKLSIGGIGLVLVIGAIWIAYHLRGKVEDKPFLKADEREVERTEKGEMDQRLSRGQSRPSASGTVEPKASGTVETKGETPATPQMKSETDEEIGKAGKIEETGEAGERADKGAEELSPELKRKVEIYTEVGKILPEFKSIWYASDDKGWLSGNTPAGARYGELLERIIALCEPFIGPPAIRRDERGVIQQVNLAPLFTQIAEHLGKELPFDGNSDYFSAKDYQGGAGGW
ncbi:hypothetical protein HYR99_32385, partial [Candidatus Poribacteria bacterium]|nr:hypothetical protein [Candidatus Poribacteria bacterium]